jgi:hypothetical protein
LPAIGDRNAEQQVTLPALRELLQRVEILGRDLVEESAGRAVSGRTVSCAG